MNIAMTAPRARNDKRINGLSKLVVGALVGFALMYSYLQAMLIKQIEMPLPIFSVLSLLLAALVAGRPVGGWRWTPLLGTIWSLFLLLGKLDLVLFELAHPENTHQFAWLLGMLSVALVAIVAGIGATIQNYRNTGLERGLPAWAPWGFTLLAGVLAGAVAVAAIPQSAGGAQVSPAVLQQLPAVTLSAFNGGEIRVKAGQLTGLRLENTDAGGHSFDVDELDVHVAMPSASNSLALFTTATPGSYTFYCRPHYDKATGQGMHGTLIVEP
jgi:plastocyanin